MPLKAPLKPAPLQNEIAPKSFEFQNNTRSEKVPHNAPETFEVLFGCLEIVTHNVFFLPCPASRAWKYTPSQYSQTALTGHYLSALRGGNSGLSGDTPLQHCPGTICWTLSRRTWSIRVYRLRPAKTYKLGLS